MITLKEIRQRVVSPYKYEAPYYIFQGKYINGKSFDIEKNYYQVHEYTSFQDDIVEYLKQFPAELSAWVMSRINYGMESGKLALITNDAVFAYIDMAHFGYYGYFAE